VTGKQAGGSAVAELALCAVRAQDDDLGWLIDVLVATKVGTPAFFVGGQPASAALDTSWDLSDGLAHRAPL